MIGILVFILGTILFVISLVNNELIGVGFGTVLCFFGGLLFYYIDYPFFIKDIFKSPKVKE